MQYGVNVLREEWQENMKPTLQENFHRIVVKIIVCDWGRREWLTNKSIILLTQMVKNLPIVQETQVQFLRGEDLLEKWMAIHSIILVWKISWTEEDGGLQSMGSQRLSN